VELRLASIVTFSEDIMKILAEQGQRMKTLAGQVQDIRQSVGHSTNAGRNEETSLSKHDDAERLADSERALVLVGDKMEEVEVQVMWQPPFQCDSHCHCACHKVRRGRSPHMLDKLLGVIFWTYSGLATTRQACDASTCLRKGDFAMQISYFFPAWYIKKAIIFTCKTMPLGGPVISLKTVRVIAHCAPIFHMIHVGDVDGIKALFRQGLASSLDVGHKKWGTPLHVC
jgi:hypothetical protein